MLTACSLALALAAQARPADDLPVVVLIGDSIRMGYAPSVIGALEGKAQVVSPEPNGGDSSNVLKNLDAWAISRNPAVVHLNAGLHDLKVDRATGAHQVEPAEYEANLRAILKRLSAETSARLILATTTPVLDERHREKKDFDRREADVLAYNTIALKVAREFPELTIDDLHAAATELGPGSALVEDGVHFTPDASKALGATVAAAIAKALDEPEATAEAACRRAPKPPAIDGTLDDPAWAAATVIDRFPSFWAGVPSSGRTRARLLWDDEALYFAADLDDEELHPFGTRRNDTLWFGDVFELFFKPSDDRPEYYEFQVNPASTILELPFARRGIDFKTLVDGPPLGMQAVAKAKAGPAPGWTVEGRIPWTAFTPSGGRPQTGATWRFALCRYDYGAEGTEPVLTSSAPLRRASFHRYEDYGHLTFEAPKPE